MQTRRRFLATLCAASVACLALAAPAAAAPKQFYGRGYTGGYTRHP